MTHKFICVTNFFDALKTNVGHFLLNVKAVLSLSPLKKSDAKEKLYKIGFIPDRLLSL
jgi:hypothetical protein